MSLGKKILLGLFTMLGLCVITGLLAPTQWSVEHSAVVNAPPERIHPLVEDLHRWSEWARPAQVDASMQYEYSGAERGVGASQRWTGSGGNGHMKILASDSATGIRYETAFLSNEVNGEASLSYSAEGDKTRVTWVGTGSVMPIVGSFFISSIETGVKEYYDTALGQLKQLAERPEAVPPSQPATTPDGGTPDAGSADASAPP